MIANVRFSIACASLLLVAGSMSTVVEAQTGDYVPGELLVKFVDDSQAHAENGKIRKTFQYTDGYRQGVWVFYDEDGQVKDRDIYKDSACIEDSCEGECTHDSEGGRLNDPNCENPIRDGGTDLGGNYIHPEERYCDIYGDQFESGSSDSWYRGSTVCGF